jgi:DNA invertase Pin-like site-specific DNA recombinase
VDREGFQKLVAEVGMGHAGLVIGLEVSRLARNCSDWHRLLEICALTDTLILDEDGLYDPAHFNDRLLLGLKGTMSEAELHVMQARMRGGLLSKARRGELQVPLPVAEAQFPTNLALKKIAQQKILDWLDLTPDEMKEVMDFEDQNPQALLPGAPPGGGAPSPAVPLSLPARRSPVAINH